MNFRRFFFIPIDCFYEKAGKWWKKFHIGLLYLCMISVTLSAKELIKDTSVTDASYWIHYYVSGQNPIEMSFSFDSNGCTITAMQSGIQEYEAAIGQHVNIQKEKTYILSMTAASEASSEVTFSIRQNSAPWFHYASRAVQLSPDLQTYTFKWVNSGPDAVELNEELFGLQLGKLKGTMRITRFSLIEREISEDDINDFECPKEPQWSAEVIDKSTLPKGFAVYSNADQGGMFITELNKWNPVRLPGENARVSLISLSDDGRWILYFSEDMPYLIRIDGKFKTPVPVPGTPTTSGFLRSSPYASEIFFDSKSSEVLYAIQVSLSDSSASFGELRIIAQIDPDYQFEDYYRLTVCKDQIWGAISSVVNGIPKKRSGFITIPESGKGTAKAEHVYKFKPDNSEEVFGCNHAMSHDGNYCVAAPGTAGETGSFTHCVPASHKGFYVTRFYKYSDQPVDVREHVHRYCESLNWCPSQYHFGEWNEIDFGNYYFTNDNQYLIAGQTGNLSPRKGLWIINWKDNTWYPLNPDDQSINVSSCAAFVGEYDAKLLSEIIPEIDTTDTIDNDPIKYKVLKPSGGELFYTGDQCTILVTSQENGNAAIKLQFDQYCFNLLSHAINPKVDSLIVITIPEFFLSRKIIDGQLVIDTIRPHSTKCKIVVEHYQKYVAKTAYSNGFFTIRSRTAIRPRIPFPGSSIKTVMTRSSINSITDKIFSGKLIQITMYDLLGRSVMRWDLHSGKPLPFDFMRKKMKSPDIYIIKYSLIDN
jgi:hypothetical protein